VLAEELGRSTYGGFAITVLVHTDMASPHLRHAGTDAQKDRYMPGIVAGRCITAVAMTEADAGSDLAGMRTTARRDGDDWVVNGSKMFITNAGTELTWGVTITARTGDDEISNIVVENGAPGYEISEPLHKLGWKASDTRALTFSDCTVPEGNLLGPRGQGFQQFLEILDGGRISVAAMGVGLAQGAYDLAFAYARERTQFGKPIGRFQAIAFKLADMAVEIEAGRQLVWKAAWLKDRGRPFALEAAMAKLYTGELSHRVVNHALQVHGGYGFMDEFPISRLYRDQKILEIGEGTNEVQRMVIAKHLGL
jgi:short/branched chain acyl-CoA dehydrogenase